MSLIADIARPTRLTSQDWHLNGAVQQGERSRELSIVEPRCRVGRRSSCEMYVAWPTISGLHAEFVSGPDSLFLRDLNSSNGTFVNGRRIHTDTPLGDGDVIHFGGVEFCVRRRIPNDEFGTAEWNAAELTSRLMGFGQLVDGDELIPFYQPIIALDDEATVAYEVLARSEHPEFSTPFEMFETAEQLDREQDLSHACRRAGVLLGQNLPGAERLFLNTQPIELGGEALVESLQTLRQRVPEQRFSLEIHEGAVTDRQSMTRLRAQLNDLDIQLVYDDFGAGQARLLDLVEVPPDVLKFDISLIREIHIASPKRRQMVGTLVALVREFGIAPLAEGIETPEEAETCRDLGFEYAQGFHFGRPAPASDWRLDPTWQTLPA